MKSLIGSKCTVHGSPVGHPDDDQRNRRSEEATGTLEDVVISDDGKIVVVQIDGKFFRTDQVGFTIKPPEEDSA